MSYALDTNVLLHAANADSPSHRVVRKLLERCARSDEPLCLTWGVISGFLRISTHAALFQRPLSPEVAMNAVDELLDLPQTRVLVEEPGFWSAYRKVAKSVAPRAKAVPDTHLAALLHLHGVRRLYTSDRDFRRFDFLEVVDPRA